MPGLIGSWKKPDPLRKKWGITFEDYVSHLALSPSGSRLGIGMIGGQVAIVDCAEGTLRRTWTGHQKGLGGLAWFGEELLVTGGHDGTVSVWNARTQETIKSWSFGKAWVEKVSASPCGKYLAFALGKTARVLDQKLNLVAEFGDMPSTITDLAWRPGSVQLAIAAYGGARLRNPENPRDARDYVWKGSTLALAWSPKGTYLASGDQDSTVHFWIASSGQDLQMSGYPSKVRELSWSSGGEYLATGGGSQPVVWKCQGKGPEGTTPWMLEGHSPFFPVTSLAFQTRGRSLVSGGGDGKIILWHPDKSTKPQKLTELGSGITHVLWEKNDQHIFASTENGQVGKFAWQ